MCTCTCEERMGIISWYRYTHNNTKNNYELSAPFNARYWLCIKIQGVIFYISHLQSSQCASNLIVYLHAKKDIHVFFNQTVNSNNNPTLVRYSAKTALLACVLYIGGDSARHLIHAKNANEIL